MIIEKDFDNWKFSSNINKVIRAVLNFFFFFYEKILHAPKAQKAPKSIKSTKCTKRHKDTQAKAQKRKWANEWLFSLYIILGAFCCCCLFVNVLCFLCSWNSWIAKFKIALITSFILLLAFTQDDNYYPQGFLKECKYIEKEKSD